MLGIAVGVPITARGVFMILMIIIMTDVNAVMIWVIKLVIVVGVLKILVGMFMINVTTTTFHENGDHSHNCGGRRVHDSGDHFSFLSCMW